MLFFELTKFLFCQKIKNRKLLRTVSGSGLRRSLVGVFLLAMILTAGCKEPSGFRNPVLKFHEASSVVIASTQRYLTELNKVERDKYIQTQASNLDTIKLAEIENVQVFSAEDIKARLDALSQLSSYGELLVKIASGDDARERISAQATSLKNSLEGLTGTLTQDAQEQNAGFKDAAIGFTTIFEEILQAVVEQKLKHALKTAVVRGEKPVNNLLLAIERDIEGAYQRRLSSLRDLRFFRVQTYNKYIAGSKPDRRKAQQLADLIREHEDRWEILASANPQRGLKAMRTAHSALVKYAKDGAKPTGLVELIEAMDVFATRAHQLGLAVRALSP